MLADRRAINQAKSTLVLRLPRRLVTRLPLTGLGRVCGMPPDSCTLFLNVGYEEDPPTGLALAEADEPYRYPIHTPVIPGGRSATRNHRSLSRL
jgi:hypothetical protein